MAVFLSTSIAAVSLFLALYFFLASYSKTGKLLVFVAACLLTLAAIGAGTFLPLWNVAVILLVLILAVSYLLSKRVELVKLQEQWEEETIGFEEAALGAAEDENEDGQKEMLVDDSIPLAKEMAKERDEAEEQDVAFPIEMANILEERVQESKDEADMGTSDEHKQPDDESMQEPSLLLEQNKSVVEESNDTGEDYIEELNFIEQRDEERPMILTESSDKQMEDVSRADMPLVEWRNKEIEPPVTNHYNLNEELDESLSNDSEESELHGEGEEQWPELDADLLALFEEGQHKEMEDVSLSYDEEEQSMFPLEKELLAEEEESTSKDMPSHEEAVYTELMEFVGADVEELEFDVTPNRANNDHEEVMEEQQEELAVLEPDLMEELVEETVSDQSSSPVLHQALWNIVLEQLQLYKQIQTPDEHEQLLKEYLSADLSDHEHYMVASMLVRHYTEQQKQEKAQQLLEQLQHMYARYPVLLEELNYLSLLINN